MDSDQARTRPSILARYEDSTAYRELVQAGHQVLQALVQRIGLGDGSVEATVLFTELCGFSTWVIEVGDERGLELLRAVAGAVEPTVATHHGRVVKRLGDGHMAVFTAAPDGLEAALDMQEQVAAIEIDGYRPQLRAGLHCGQPRQMAGDLLGTDVNIAARVSEAARAGEVLVTGPVLEAIDPPLRERLEVKRRRGFRAKGAPPGLDVYRVSRG